MAAPRRCVDEYRRCCSQQSLIERSRSVTSGLVSELQARSVRRSELYVEVTGMIQVGNSTSLYVAVVPVQIRSGRRVVVTDALFEMFTLQRLQIEFVRRLGEAGVPAIYVQTPGAGDGDGDPRWTLVADRLQAVLQAADVLESLSGVGARCFVAARLGAVVILKAILETPASICLWDPLLDLHAYMRGVIRLERASRALSGRPSASEATTDDGSWRDWAGSSTFGVEVSARQLEDFDLECSRLLGSRSSDVEALAVFVNDRSATTSRPSLEEIIGPVDVVTLGLRDPLQLGLRKGETALDPTVQWIIG